MKPFIPLGTILLLLCLSACTTPSPPSQQLRLAKPKASTQDFEADRYMCLQDSLRKQSGADTKDYDGSIAKDALPSRSEYIRCMTEKNWQVVSEGGFLPQIPTAMTDSPYCLSWL